MTQQAPPAPPTRGVRERPTRATTRPPRRQRRPAGAARTTPPRAPARQRRHQGRPQRSLPVRLGQEVQALPWRMNGTFLRALQAAIEQVLIGKTAEVELAIIGLAANGHLLIEDVPGVGKTMLAKSLARATGCTFKRIQFTPDLLATSRAFRSTTSAAASSSSALGRSSPTSCSPTRSIAPRRRPSHVARGDGRAAGDRRRRHPAAAGAVHRARDDPDRVRGRFRCPRRSSTASCCAFTSARAVAGGGGARERQMLRHPIEDLRAVTSANERSRCSRRCAACTSMAACATSSASLA